MMELNNIRNTCSVLDQNINILEDELRDASNFFNQYKEIINTDKGNKILGDISENLKNICQDLEDLLIEDAEYIEQWNQDLDAYEKNTEELQAKESEYEGYLIQHNLMQPSHHVTVQPKESFNETQASELYYSHTKSSMVDSFLDNS